MKYKSTNLPVWKKVYQLKCQRGLEDKSTFYFADFANSNTNRLKQN